VQVSTQGIGVVMRLDTGKRGLLAILKEYQELALRCL
jgi:hypothetical protein